MADEQKKRGGLVSLEGLILEAIDNMNLPSGEVWYEYLCGGKQATLQFQASGDVAMDMCLNSGDAAAPVWTIKSGTVLSMDAQIYGKPIYFRHHQSSAQKLQVIRLT